MGDDGFLRAMSQWTSEINSKGEKQMTPFKDYILTNTKSGHSCIFVGMKYAWEKGENALIRKFEEMERELGVGEIEIKMKRIRREETFSELRKRKVLKNYYEDKGKIDIIYLSKEENKREEN